MSSAPVQVGPSPVPSDALYRTLDIATGRTGMPIPPQQPHPEAGKIVQLIKSLRQQGDGEMTAYRVKWAMTDAFLSDSQWTALNAKTGQVQNIGNPKNRPRLQVNKFKRWHQAALARLVATHPQLVIKPGSSEDKVVNSARVFTKVIGEHESQEQGLDETMVEFMSGLLAHGDSALEVDWNPKAKYIGPQPKPMRLASGNKVQAVTVTPGEPDPMTGMPGQPSIAPAFEPDGVTPQWEPERDDDGNVIMEDQWEGANETNYIRSADIISDPSAVRPKDAGWWIISVAKSPAFVFNRWGVEVQADGQNRSWESQRFNRNFRWNVRPNTVTVDKLWIKAGTYRFGANAADTITFPKGFVAVCAGDRLLDCGENYRDDGEIPIIFERAIVQDGQMRGDTFMNSLREIQVARNKFLSIAAHAAELHCSPQMICPTDCDVPEEDKNNDPSTWIRYTVFPEAPDAKPERIEPSAPSNFLVNAIQMLDADGADISGQHEGGMAGGAPTGIETGVALEALVERDTTMLSTVASAIGRARARWAMLTAGNMKQFMTGKRLVSVTGEWNEPEAMEFNSLDIADTFIYTTAPASVLPQSKAAEFQKNMALVQAEIITPREFMQRTGEDRSETMTAQQMQAANARKENYLAQTTGIITTPPQAVAFDDPQIHGDEHMRAILDRDFMMTNQQGWIALVQHYTNPLQMGGHGLMPPAMILQMMQQPMGPGGPAGPGTPMSGAPMPAGPPPPSGPPNAPPNAPPDPGSLSVPRPGVQGPGGGFKG